MFGASKPSEGMVALPSLNLADYLLIAEAVLGVPAETIASGEVPRFDQRSSGAEAPGTCSCHELAAW